MADDDQQTGLVCDFCAEDVVPDKGSDDIWLDPSRAAGARCGSSTTGFHAVLGSMTVSGVKSMIETLTNSNLVAMPVLTDESDRGVLAYCPACGVEFQLMPKVATWSRTASTAVVSFAEMTVEHRCAR